MFVFLFKYFFHIACFVFNSSKEIFACKLNFEELIFSLIRKLYRDGFHVNAFFCSIFEFYVRRQCQ